MSVNTRISINAKHYYYYLCLVEKNLFFDYQQTTPSLHNTGTGKRLILLCFFKT